MLTAPLAPLAHSPTRPLAHAHSNTGLTGLTTSTEFGTTVSKDAPPPIERTSTQRPGGNTAATGPAQQARAMYEWKATADEQLDIAEGEIVTVINDAKKWWTVRNAQGSEGTVPSNYMEKIDGDGPAGFEDNGGAPPPLVSREAKPMLPDEQEECIYEPVDNIKAPPDLPAPQDAAAPASNMIVVEDEDWASHVYEDPDNPVSPKRPNVVRSASIIKVPDAAPALSQSPKDWMNSDVLRWLKSEDLKDFQDVFYANGFDGATLVTLHSSSFKAGGFDAERCDVLQLSLDKLADMGASKGRATAVYDYDATKSTQLSFSEGDIVTLPPLSPSLLRTHPLPLLSAIGTTASHRDCFFIPRAKNWACLNSHNANDSGPLSAAASPGRYQRLVEV